MPCIDCPTLGDVAAIIGLAILVAAAAAWLTGTWLKTRFLENAVAIATARTKPSVPIQGYHPRIARRRHP
jgi:hypothetical protein